MITEKIANFIFEEVNKDDKKDIAPILKIKDKIALFIVTLVLIFIPITMGWIINNYGDKIRKYLIDIFNLGCG